MFQRLTIIGNLGRDPETKELNSGAKVTNFPVATTEKWKDKDGEQQERTEWHNCDAWNKVADIAQNYLSKGQPVHIEGKVRTDKWQDQEGNDRYTPKVIVQSLTLLPSKNASNDKDQGGGAKAQEHDNSSAAQPNDISQKGDEGSKQVDSPKSDDSQEETNDLPF